MGGRVDPVVTRKKTDASISAIVDRRAATFDEHLEDVKDDPFPLVKLVAEDPHSDDVVPALWVLAHLRRVLDEREGVLLRAGHAAGLSYRTMGEPLGLGSRQAVRARMLASAARAGQARAVDPEPPTLTQAQWVTTRGRDLEAAANALLACRNHLTGEDIEQDLDDLETALVSVPAREGRLRVKRLGVVAARLRFLLEDITGVATAQAEQARDRVAELAADHRRTI